MGDSVRRSHQAAMRPMAKKKSVTPPTMSLVSKYWSIDQRQVSGSAWGGSPRAPRVQQPGLIERHWAREAGSFNDGQDLRCGKDGHIPEAQQRIVVFRLHMGGEVGIHEDTVMAPSSRSFSEEAVARLPGATRTTPRCLPGSWDRVGRQRAALWGSTPIRRWLLEGKDGDRRRVTAERAIERNGVLVLDIRGHECHGHAGGGRF